MALFDKVKGKLGDMMESASRKLTYSDEDIASRKAKEGIKYVFDGGNGTLLEVYEDRVILCHSKSLLGDFAGFFENNVGEKTLYYTDISSVEFKEAQKFCIGYIRFSVLNGSELRKTVADAASDPNSVAIGRIERNAEATEITKYLNQKMSEVRKKDPTGVVVQQTSNADELRKYKELLDSGIITQAEFDAKKSQLLGL